MYKYCSLIDQSQKNKAHNRTWLLLPMMNELKKQPCERCGTLDRVDIYFGSIQKEIWLCKSCRKQMLLGR